ncbi:hypothetical protein Nepgr_017459 [Nepenthes gracilis]|uniref:Uncharacterized protein n=1 Tax=Nepenthes gracilis TaxID=150966 RepID=A0AAD3SPG7_NEPGR|nr:hypothetical protein Nepgr_017459 [Nepenthes gracilis]
MDLQFICRSTVFASDDDSFLLLLNSGSWWWNVDVAYWSGLSSVKYCPSDQLPAVLVPSIVNDPLIPSGPPRLSRSECSLVDPKLKVVIDCPSSVTGLESSGTPAILSQALSDEGLLLEAESAPDSDPPDVTVASPTDSEDSVYSVDAKSVPVVGIPRIASCPAMLQLQSGGCTPCFPIGHTFAEILCRGLDGDSQGVLVEGVPCWTISEEDRKAALGLVVDCAQDPHPPGVDVPKLESALSFTESELACDPGSYTPGPLDLDDNTPPSISRILTKYSLETSSQLGLGLSSPKGLNTNTSTVSQLDTRKVSYLGSQVAPSQQESWQPVKSRRNQRSASKDAKLTRADSCAGTWVDLIPCSEAVLAVAAALDVYLLDSPAMDDADELWILLSGLLAGAGFGTQLLKDSVLGGVGQSYGLPNDVAGHYLQQAEELATAWRMLCKMSAYLPGCASAAPNFELCEVCEFDVCGAEIDEGLLLMVIAILDGLK